MDARQVPDLRFLVEAFGDVVGNSTKADDLAVLVEARRAGAFEDVHAAIAMVPAHVPTLPALAGLGQELQLLDDFAAILGEQEVLARHRREFPGCIAKNALHRAVGISDAGIQVAFPDPVIAAFDNGAKALFAVAQGMLDLLAFVP